MSLLLLLLAAAPPAAPPAPLVDLTVDARIQRGGKEFSATVGTHIRTGDLVTFHVTSSQDGHLSLINYAPSGFVETQCPPAPAAPAVAPPCRSEPLHANQDLVLGPFAVQNDAGWEIFDLVLTREPVDPNDLLRFGRTKSLDRGAVIGVHAATATKLANQPELLESWVTFALYHEP